ncbi:nitroreductase family protein [Streptomyces sp. NPDC026672]|uniref:Acg family FMN-binding oxidoreductase n=1 Tax=unclassified Streptomyces TaxID=2593676 RepID=UPI0033FF3C0F
MRTQAVDTTTPDTLLTAATAAPSIHNTQPWRLYWNADTRTVEVRSAAERSLPLADPRGRARHVSVGAAVFNLRLAAARLGGRPYADLLPDPARPDLLATVHPLDPPRPDEGPGPCADLYDAIPLRHTCRLPFTGRPVPESVVAEMTEAARTEGARLYVPGITATRRLLRVTALAEARNRASAPRTAEARAWITAPGTRSPYGIPLTALGPLDAAGRMPVRDFTGPLPAWRLPPVTFERHTQVALLWTANDRREDWLRAGQALQHVLLTATAHGVRTSVLHQAMEWPDLRAAMCEPKRQYCPHALIRFGYGPDGVPTPRARARQPRRPAPRPAPERAPGRGPGPADGARRS